MILEGGEFDYKKLSQDLSELKLKTSNPEIWKDLNAKHLFQSIRLLERRIQDFKKIDKSLSDLKELYALSLNEKDIRDFKTFYVFLNCL